jgi:hypothetical protein
MRTASSPRRIEPGRLGRRARLAASSVRAASRFVPQIAQPAANGLTGSRQLGHLLIARGALTIMHRVGAPGQ